MGDCCSNGVMHFEEGQAAEMWNERGNRSLKTMLGLTFSRGFQLWIFCGRRDRDFGWLARRASIVDESTVLPSALDGTEEVRLGYYTAITLCQDFSDISARPSGMS